MGKVSFGIFELGEIFFWILTTVISMSLFTLCVKEIREDFFLDIPWESYFFTLEFTSVIIIIMIILDGQAQVIDIFCMSSCYPTWTWHFSKNIWIYAPKIEVILTSKNLNIRAKNRNYFAWQKFEFWRQKLNSFWILNIWIFAPKI